MKYVNLNAKSTFSTPYAVAPVIEHYKKAIELGHGALAINDLNSYASFFPLIELRDSGKNNKKLKKTLENAGIKNLEVVLGASVSVYEDIIERDPKTIIVDTKGDKRFSQVHNGNINPEKDFKEVLYKSNHGNHYISDNVILLVKNETGHKNLCKIVTETSYPDNVFKGNKRISMSRLYELSEGLIIMVGGQFSAISRLLKNDNEKEAKSYLDSVIKQFGKENTVLEIQALQNKLVYRQESKSFNLRKSEERDYQEVTNNFLRNYGKENDIRLTITQSSCMPSKDFWQAQDTLIKKRKHTTPLPPEPQAMMSVEELWNKFNKMYPYIEKEEFDRWCENSYEIAKKCFGVNPSREFKIADTPIDAHVVNNPIVLTERYYEKAHELELIKSGSDKYFINIKTLESITQKGDLSGLADISKELSELNYKDFIDTEKTKENEEIIKKNIPRGIERLEYFAKSDYRARVILNLYKNNKNTKTMIDSIFFKNRFDLENNERFKELINELKVVCANGIIELSPYFLSFEIATDLGNYIGKTAGLGRGSGVGSIINYSLGVTGVKPWEWDLLFERFLVPERIGLIYPEFEDTKKLTPEDTTLESIDHCEEINKILKDRHVEITPEIEQELFFMECNPHLATYFLGLFRDNYRGENKQNSHLAYALGLCEKPTSEVSRSPRSLPDIDFDTNYKDDICSFFQRLYGVEKTCYIGSYMELKLKSSFLDVARGDGSLTAQEILKLAKEFDKYDPLKNDEGEVIESTVDYFYRVTDESPSLRAVFSSREHLKKSLEKCLGSYSGMGIHAGGFVSSPIDITDSIPANWDEGKKALVSQLAKDELEAMGLIKNDYLGLSTLSILEHACEMINKDNPDKEPISIDKIIETRCSNSLNHFTQNTLGVFQFMGDVVTQGMNKLKSFEIHHIPFFTGLYRPGPMGSNFHNKGIALVNKNQDVEIFDDSLSDILDQTLGLIIYQEQVMAITKKIGGFNGFEADTVRRAMGKKKLDVIVDFEKKFVDHAVSEFNYAPKKAKNLWDALCKFSEYGFNKSHAVAYGLTSYACMYLNYHYKNYFRAASLNDACVSANKRDIYKKYQLAWGAEISPPCINKSDSRYTVRDNEIVMPLFSIKGVGEKTSKKISNLAPFENMNDFALRCKAHKSIDAKTFKNLAIAGALDCLKPDIEKVKKNGGIEEKIELIQLLRKNINPDIKEKINLEIPLSPKDIESINIELSGVGFLPILSYRKKIFEETLHILGLKFKKLDDIESKNYKELKELAKKTSIAEEDIEALLVESKSIDYKSEAYKLLDIQNFDIKGAFGEDIDLIGGVYMADEVYKIEEVCKEYITSFDDLYFERLKSNDSILGICLRFYNNFLPMSPGYKIGSFFGKKIKNSLKSMNLFQIVEFMALEDKISNKFLWKNEFSIPLDKEEESFDFQKVFYRPKTGKGEFLTNYSHLAICALYQMIIEDKDFTLKWASTFKSNSINRAIDNLKKITKQEAFVLKGICKKMTSLLGENNKPERIRGNDFVDIDLPQNKLMIFNGQVNVCGSVFKLPKKMKEGIREIRDRKTGDLKTMFKFNLSNKGKQIMALSFEADNCKYSRIHSRKSQNGTMVEREALGVKIHDDLDNYDSVIVKGSANYSIDYDPRIQIIIEEVVKLNNKDKNSNPKPQLAA